MAIKLLKACKELNIGMSTAIEFCKTQGVNILAESPNARIDDDLYLLLAKVFNQEVALKLEAERAEELRQWYSQQRNISTSKEKKDSCVVEMTKQAILPDSKEEQNTLTDSKKIEKISSNKITHSNELEIAVSKKELIKLGKLGWYGNEDEQLLLLNDLNKLTEKNIESILELSSNYLNLSHFDDLDNLRLIYSTLVDKNGNAIVFWFTKDFSGKHEYTDFECGLLSDFDMKRNIISQYRWGNNIFFSDRQLADKLLKDISKRAMPEQWSWSKNSNLDILQSYITYTFIKLLNEDKSELKDKCIQEGIDEITNETVVAFNTNLLDKNFEDIFISGDKIAYKEGYLLKNPRVVTKRELVRYGIKHELLPPPTYFTDINDILFHSDWQIQLDDYDKMEHILKRKDERVDKEITISDLKAAIDNSKKMAQRNYKYVVPMYFPTKNRIQLLMPLYFEGKFKGDPDGILILTPDSITKFYIPETIIGLREAYIDARLIAKPENAWLTPKSRKIAITKNSKLLENEIE